MLNGNIFLISRWDEKASKIGILCPLLVTYPKLCNQIDKICKLLLKLINSSRIVISISRGRRKSNKLSEGRVARLVGLNFVWNVRGKRDKRERDD